MRAEDKALLRALRGPAGDRPAYWLMRQAGRYLPEYREIRGKVASFIDLCLNPELATEVTLQPIRRFGMDGAILFSDILMIPHGLGQKVEFQEGLGPSLEPIRKADELGILQLGGMEQRLAPVYETIRRVKYELPPETALIGFAGSPWTVATYVVEGRSDRRFAVVKGWASQDSAGFGKLIELLTEATIQHLEGQISAGVELVQLFDSWCGVLADNDFARWVVEPTRKIITALKAKYPNVPIIGYPRGAGSQYVGYARDTGVDILSLDENVPLSFARDVLQPLVPVQGNLDPILLATGGVALDTRTREIVSALGRGRFIFNLGHGVVPHTTPENVSRIGELLRTRAAATSRN